MFIFTPQANKPRSWTFFRIWYKSKWFWVHKIKRHWFSALHVLMYPLPLTAAHLSCLPESSHISARVPTFSILPIHNQEIGLAGYTCQSNGTDEFKKENIGKNWKDEKNSGSFIPSIKKYTAIFRKTLVVAGISKNIGTVFCQYKSCYTDFAIAWQTSYKRLTIAEQLQKTSSIQRNNTFQIKSTLQDRLKEGKHLLPH